MMRRLPFVVPMALCLEAVPALGTAQLDTVSIPVDLAMALLSAQGGDNRIIVDGTPVWVDEPGRRVVPRTSWRSRWTVRSLEASPSPYSPGRKLASGSLLMAVVTNTRSPQTTGVDAPGPAVSACHTSRSPGLQ